LLEQSKGENNEMRLRMVRLLEGYGIALPRSHIEVYLTQANHGNLLMVISMG
jgi:hypothetical protein